MLQTFRLKNGIKVATYSLPKLKSVFLAQSVKCGSIFDSEANSGLAHFMEHILVEGIPSYPTVEQLSEYLESLAGSYNASTGSLSVRFSISAPAIKIENLIQVASEVFFEPLFLDSAIEKERQAILSEIYQRQDQIWYKNSKFFREIRYKKGHPLLLDGGGSEKAIKKISKKEIVDYWSRFFHPQNNYLIVVGGISNSAVKKYLEKYYGKYQSAKKFPQYPNLTRDDMLGPGVHIRRDDDFKTCYLDISFPSTTIEDPVKDTINHSIIKSILANLRRSRLFSLLRQKLGIVYGIGMGSVAYQKFGYTYISTQASPENLDQVIEILAREFSVFYKNGPTEAEVEFAKNYHINKTLMQFDHPADIADWIEGDLLWEDKIYTPEEYVAMYQNVNVCSVKKFMEKYWDLSKLQLIIQGPIDNTQANINKYSELIY